MTGREEASGPGVRISIVVLTYNRTRLLKDCLDSLLSQNYPPELLEILVADDGSTDGTNEMVARLVGAHSNLRYLHQEHKGIAATRNLGVRKATGEIIAIVADDYILDPDYAGTIASFFEQNPRAMIVRFKIVASRDDLASSISHFYYDVSVRRRLAPDSDLSHRGLTDRLARLFRRIPPFEETITTQHRLEASGAAAFRRSVFDRAGLFEDIIRYFPSATSMVAT
jgi:glycosyltransferase involved in cell wall biosynthesis